eukprot:gene1114-650_t
MVSLLLAPLPAVGVEVGDPRYAGMPKGKGQFFRLVVGVLDVLPSAPLHPAPLPGLQSEHDTRFDAHIFQGIFLSFFFYGARCMALLYLVTSKILF